MRCCYRLRQGTYLANVGCISFNVRCLRRKLCREVITQQTEQSRGRERPISQVERNFRLLQGGLTEDVFRRVARTG